MACPLSPMNALGGSTIISNASINRQPIYFVRIYK